MTDPATTSHWAAMHRHWSLLGAPLRPPAEAVARMAAAAGDAARGRTLVLGVTPELHGAFDDVTALDANAGMIERVWPGNTERKRAVLGDWTTDIPGLGHFDLCVGDLSLSQLGAAAARQVVGAAARALRPGGRFVMRSMCSPEPEVTADAIIAYADAPGFNWHVLRLLIGLHLSQTVGPGFPVHAIHAVFTSLFPDRGDFLARTGLEPEALALVDHYAGSSLVWLVPDAAGLCTLAEGTGLRARLEPSGRYQAAEHLPILVLEA
ncbi:class I SAM-dependent methyltransferase [Defluviimonas sp. WL0002]|uniref:Class I SAM-dependent methyltransferase n=1 Tax=Albidovulum marisflavi TaxID=2984159 RepID=A0ABT2ZH00_9RHOB|nr:class I SAM-dependent methyltransferase [Defluviimonas sp. WL0002]MCV2870419.1 class I SAM-dependent methyltransferase [Defluviimonas sp. WL0002]